MRLLLYSTSSTVVFDEQMLLSSGGNAFLYQSPADTRLVAKIYHPDKALSLARLKQMIANPPADPTAGRNHVSIAWPQDILVPEANPEEAAGFLMPGVFGTHGLGQVCAFRDRLEHAPRFTYKDLVRTALNLSLTFAAIHRGGYVIGGFNAWNIGVTDTGLVTIFDTDSFQVIESVDGSVHFAAAGQAGFNPPELLHLEASEGVERTFQHDYFAMAVLFFQVLLEGLHPFAGVLDDNAAAPDHDANIAAGRFAHHRRREIPDQARLPMPSFEMLPPEIRDLFVRCFEQGHGYPLARPDASRWETTLRRFESSLQTCPRNSQHFYSDHLVDCPWCERARESGDDLYPAIVEEKAPTHIRVPPPPAVFPAEPPSAWLKVAAVVVSLFIIAGLVIAFRPPARDEPRSPSPAGAPAAPVVPVSNTTLSYASHTSDVNIFFEGGIGAAGSCTVDAARFEARGGGSFRETRSYSIKSLDAAKWRITLTAADPRATQNIVFWTSVVNAAAADNQAVVEARGNIYDNEGHALWPQGDRSMRLTFRRGNYLPSPLPQSSGPAPGIAEGYTIPSYTLSPDGNYGVLVPDANHYNENSRGQNKLVSVKTGQVVANINGETWFEDNTVHMNYGSIAAHWSQDGTVLSWVVGGKWSPRTYALLKVRDGSLVWQLDVLARAQAEILTRTRAAVPVNYAAAVRQNQGSGSAFPDGFTIDVATPGAAFSLPWKGKVTLDADPKNMPGWPAVALVRASTLATIHPDGSATFSDYTVSAGRSGTAGETQGSDETPPAATAFPGERYPATRLRLLSSEEVARMSPATIRYSINEVYARHGANFRDKDIRALFQGFGWYHPSPGRSDDAAEADFTEVEKENVKLLGTYRDSRKGAIPSMSAPLPPGRRAPPKTGNRSGASIDERTHSLDNL